MRPKTKATIIVQGFEPLAVVLTPEPLPPVPIREAVQWAVEQLGNRILDAEDARRVDALEALLNQAGCEGNDPAVTDGLLTTLCDVIIRS